MKRKILVLSVVLALVAVLAMPMTVMAATQTVTVTAQPYYVSITNVPDTWTINGLGTGSESTKGKIKPNITYYANPINSADDITAPSATVLDTECAFAVSNPAGGETVNITITWGDFTGGGADMTNSNDGSNGTTSFGAYCWYAGMTYASKVIAKSSGSSVMYTGLTAGSHVDWGVEIKTRTNDWSSATASTSTITVTAAAS